MVNRQGSLVTVAKKTGQVPGAQVNGIAARPVDARGLTRVDLDTGAGALAQARQAAARAEEAAAGEMARTFSQLSSQIGAYADRARAIEGEQAGLRDGLDPEFRPSNEATIYARARDDAGLRVYRQQMSTRLASSMEEIAAQHEADPRGMAAAFTRLRKGFEPQLFDEVRPDFEAQFERAELSYTRQATREMQSRVRAREAASLQSDLQTRLRQVEQHAYRLGLDSEADAMLASEVAALSKSLHATDAVGRPLVAPQVAQDVLSSAEASIRFRRVEGFIDRLQDPVAQHTMLEAIVADAKAGRSDILTGVPDKQVEALRQRLREQREASYDAAALGDLHLADEAEIVGRLDALRADGLDKAYRNKLFDKVVQEAAKLRKQRLTDPAQSVLFDERVVAARQARQAGDAESMRNYVSTLIEVQKEAGIYAPSALPMSEARQLYAIVDRALPHEVPTRMRELAAFAEDVYGEHAPLVMRDIIHSASGDRQVADLAMPLIEAMQNGQPARAADLEHMRRLQSIRQMEGGSPDGGEAIADDGTESWSPLPPFSKQVPSPAAVQELVANPYLADEFDEAFGEGSARAILADEARRGGAPVPPPFDEPPPDFGQMSPFAADADQERLRNGVEDFAIEGAVLERIRAEIDAGIAEGEAELEDDAGLGADPEREIDPSQLQDVDEIEVPDPQELEDEDPEQPDLPAHMISPTVREMLGKGRYLDAVNKHIEENGIDPTDGAIMDVIFNLTGVELSKEEFLATVEDDISLDDLLAQKGVR